MGNQEWTIQ